MRSADAPVLDDDEGGDAVYAEALEELGVFLLGDAKQPEGLVIAAALEDLGEEAVDAPAAARRLGVEDEQLGPVRHAGRSGVRGARRSPAEYREKPRPTRRGRGA